jgi:prepilin-type N-terminal cleavage/methylation domain-containing protein/prepilin-type processing-associated H-X9-DG protein
MRRLCVLRKNCFTQAFTLIECLVVIAVLSILALLALTPMKAALGRAAQTKCANNLKQLGMAFSMYWDDHNGTSPGAASRTAYGPQTIDWIWWQRSRDLQKSRIAPYVSGFGSDLLTCPSHRTAQGLQKRNESKGDPYRYSYTITSFQIEDGWNYGLASIMSTNGIQYPFRIARVQNPSATFLLVEENVLDDGRWVPADLRGTDQEWIPRLQQFTSRHNRKCNSLLVDSHVDSMVPSSATNLRFSLSSR